MKTKIIIYDNNCPLCAAYTSAFTKTGLLDKEGRRDFSTITPELLDKIDSKRSVNEIPLLDTATGEVWYGVDALLEILHQKIPVIKRMGNIRPVKWLLLQCYKCISFNRRVIVAANNQPGKFDCTPDFSISYRIGFMALFLIINTLLIFPLHEYVMNQSIFTGTNIYQLQLAHAIVVLINIIIATRLSIKEGLEYLGQINMLALVVLLLTIPLIVFNKYTNLHHGDSNSFYLGMVSLFAFQEYIRRMKFISFTKKYRTVILVNTLCVAAFFTYLLL